MLAITLCGVSIVLATSNSGTNAVLSVNTPDGEFLYQMNQDQTLQLQGLEGISVIQIQQGKAFFSESPCPNKTCIATAAISNNGEWAACLPNGIFISIQQKSESPEIDIIAF